MGVIGQGPKAGWSPMDIWQSSSAQQSELSSLYPVALEDPGLEKLDLH